MTFPTESPERDEAVYKALVDFVGETAGYSWVDQTAALSADSAERFFWTLRLVKLFLGGELPTLHFRGRHDPVMGERPSLELHRVRGRAHTYVVVNPTYPYVIMFEDTQRLQLALSTALTAPLVVVMSKVPVEMRLLKHKPTLVTDALADATWYQIDEYKYLAVFPGEESLRLRVVAYGSWSSSGGRPESVDLLTVLPSDVDRWVKMVEAFEANAPTVS